MYEKLEAELRKKGLTAKDIKDILSLVSADIPEDETDELLLQEIDPYFE